MLASAIAVYDAPVVPLAAPAPGSPAPLPQPGTFTTEQEKLQAALPKFREAADRYPTRRPAWSRNSISPASSPRWGSTRRRSRRIRKWSARAATAASTGAPRAWGWPTRRSRRASTTPAITIYTETEPRHDLADPGRQRADAARSRLRAGRPEGGSGADVRPHRPGVPAVDLRWPTPARARGGPQVLKCRASRTPWHPARALHRVRRARERELPDPRRRADQRRPAPPMPFAAHHALGRRHRLDVVEGDDRALVPAHVLHRARDLALLDQEQARRASAR